MYRPPRPLDEMTMAQLVSAMPQLRDELLCAVAETAIGKQYTGCAQSQDAPQQRHEVRIMEILCSMLIEMTRQHPGGSFSTAVLRGQCASLQQTIASYERATPWRPADKPSTPEQRAREYRDAVLCEAMDSGRLTDDEYRQAAEIVGVK